MTWWIVTVLACIASFGLGTLVGRGTLKVAWETLKARATKMRQERTARRAQDDAMLPSEKTPAGRRKKRDKHDRGGDDVTKPLAWTTKRQESDDESGDMTLRLLPDKAEHRVSAAHELDDSDLDLTRPFAPYAHLDDEVSRYQVPSTKRQGAVSGSTGRELAPLRTPKTAHAIAATPAAGPGGPAVPEPAEDRVQKQEKFSITVRSRQGGTDQVDFLSGHTWLADQLAEIAVDMHMRSTPTGDLLVSVRHPDRDAFIALEQGRLDLAQVEIPWREGVIRNGKVAFEWEPARRSSSVLTVRQQPSQPNSAQVRTVRSWLTVTHNQPQLALEAAHLFLPDDLDPIGEWRRRLGLYLDEKDAPPDEKDAPVGLVAIIEDRLLLSGVSELEIGKLGIGRAQDSTPKQILTFPDDDFTSIPLSPSQLRLWLPVVTGEYQWSTGSFMVDRETVPALQR